MNRNYKETVLRIIKEANLPLAIETIRTKAGIGSWVTTKSVLLELLIDKRISGTKTSKSWIFSKLKTGETDD